jgi:hypothetical protein
VVKIATFAKPQTVTGDAKKRQHNKEQLQNFNK